MSILMCMPYLKAAAAPTKISQAKPRIATSPVHTAGVWVT
jgi:hypothetical protein